jgi:pimeloyl-ACP methyl ester carboxylesterase
MWDWLGAKPGGAEELDRRLGHLRDVTRKVVTDAGHMLHHDQPVELARMIEEFLAR